jgi:hypothetical protein
LEQRAPSAAAKLRVTVAELEPQRAGALELSLDGDVTNADGVWHVHADLATYVRDVVTTEALYDVTSRPFGSGPEMR